MLPNFIFAFTLLFKSYTGKKIYWWIQLSVKSIDMSVDTSNIYETRGK